MRRKHVLLVQNYRKTKGQLGQNEYSEPDGDPIRVPANAHALTSDEVTTYGLQTVEARHVYADFWPGNPHSRITFNGKEWDPVGEAVHHDITSNAQSWQLIIRKRG